MAERALATAFVNIVPGTKQMEQYLKGQLPAEFAAAGTNTGGVMAKSLSSGFGSKLKGYIAPIAAGFAASFAAVGVGNLFKDAISNASDFAEQGAAVGQIFGKAQEDIQKFAAGGSKSLGQSKIQVLAAAKQFGIYGNAAGLAGADNADFAKTLVGVATDLASFNNTSVDDAINALGSGLRGEAEPLRQYGVLLDDATLRAKALEMGLIKTTKDALSPQAKVLAGYGVIMEQTKTQQGDFERTSAGLANQQRILSAQMENVGITVGTALLPAVNGLVTFFNNNLVPALDGVYNFFKQYGSILVIVAGVILTVMLPAIITSTVASVSAWGIQTGAAIKNSTMQLAAAYKTIGGWVMMGAQALINAAKTVAGWVISSAGAIANAAIMVAQFARVVAGWVLMGAQSLIQAARMAAAWLIAMGPVGIVIAAVVALAALIIANWSKISAFTATAWKAITAWVSDAWNKMVSAVSTGINNVVNFFKALPGNILKAIGNLGGLLLSAGKNIIDGLLNGLKNAAAGALNFVKDLGKNIATTFKNMLGIKSPSKVFHEFGQNIIDGLKEGLTSDEAGVMSTMKKVGDWVADNLFNKKISAKTAAAATRLIATYTAKIAPLAKAHDQVLKDLTAAEDDYANKVKARLDFLAGIREKFGNKLAIEDTSTAADAIKQLKDRIAKNQALIGVMKTLKDLGLSGNLYQQILDSGNLEFAQSIAAGGSQTVSELNALASAANDTAMKLGEDAAGILFDSGIQAAQGVLDGLKARESELRSFMESIASSFAAAISAAIGADTTEADLAAAAKKKTATKKVTAKKATTKAPAKISSSKAGAAIKKVTPKISGGKTLKFATGGLVNRPTRALIGESGPELVTPLREFERLVAASSGGQNINYYAAPNQSLDAEQALRTAMIRMKALVR